MWPDSVKLLVPRLERSEIVPSGKKSWKFVGHQARFPFPQTEFVTGGHFGGRIRLNSRFSCLGEEEFYLPARTSKNLPDTQDSHSPKPDYEEFVADGHFCYRFRLNSWFPGVTKVELYVTAKILRNLPAKIGKSKIPFPSNRITKNSWSADTLAAGFG